MDRRTFLIEAGKAFPILAGATYFLSCGGSSTSPMSNALVVTSAAADGHTHSVSVPRADLDPPQADHAYTSGTTQGHQHSVVLSAAQLAAISGGGTVTVTSSATSGHSHDFTFRL